MEEQQQNDPEKFSRFLELTALGIDPADEVWLFDDSEPYTGDLSRHKFYQQAHPDKRYTYDQLQQFKEIFGWRGLLILPDDGR